MLAVLKGKQVKEATTADGCYLAISFNDGDSGLNVYIPEPRLPDRLGRLQYAVRDLPSLRFGVDS